jgi:hypothetical protein
MFGVVVVYAGLVAAFLGGISVLKPLTFLRIRSRILGLCIFGLGILLVFLGWLVPAGDFHVASAHTYLDEFAPNYQFNEVHAIRVHAPKDRVFEAMKAVTADDIFLFRTLTWIRRLGGSNEESILNPPPGAPILDVALRTGFLLLAKEPDREVVLGTAVAAPPGFRPSHRSTPEDFKNVRQPGFVLAAMNFRFEDDGPGVTLVTTETRIFATSTPARRRFQMYWRVIYPGSALIRRMWLRAIKKRAEAPAKH